VLSFAPRISPRLLEALVRLDDKRVPIAEVNRRVGAAAERLGLPRPSYQRVRELVHAARRLRRYQPSTLSVVVDATLGTRPPVHVLDHLTGHSVPVRGP
jgi:hypothetical protein